MGLITQKVCSVNDLKDGEKKDFQIGDKRILVSRLSGKFYATSNTCCHYKAPLSASTLTPEGRLMCHWHGACFDIKTGDVEDAPTFDALATYEVKVEGQDVIVTADEDILKEARRVPTCSAPAAGSTDARVFVIIGGGPAGFCCATTLREEGFQGKVILVSSEPHLPIDRIKLSKAVSNTADKLLLRSADFYAKAGIETLLSTTVTGVEPSNKSVTLADGRVLKYDQLFIATGGTPRFFWGNPARFSNVFQVRTLVDSEGIEKCLGALPEGGKNSNLVIVGSSFIGMEAAALLVSKVSSCTVIGMEKVPFERVLGEKIGGILQALHESKNVKFRMGATVKEFAEEGGRCTAIRLTSGEEIPADLVIIGAGVAPTTGFLKNTFNLEKDGSVLVDLKLRVRQFEDVYAGGDIARYDYSFDSGHDGNVRIEHWNIASQHGRIAARNMLGKGVTFSLVPFFWTSMYGKSIRYVGHALNYDDVIIQGSTDLDTLAFIAYYVKGDQVLAVSSLGKDPACSNASELMRLGKLPTATQVRAGKSVLDLASFFPEFSTPAATPAAAAPTHKKISPPAVPPEARRSQGKKQGGSSMRMFIILALIGLGLGWFFFFK